MDLSSIASNINYRYQQSSQIQIGGTVSGLDTASIIDKLMQIESLPLQRLNDKYVSYTNTQKAYRQVSDKIRELYNFTADFSLQSNLIPKSATSSSNILTATASAAATDGVYSVTVQSIASNSVLQTGKIGKEITAWNTISEMNTRYTPANSTIKIKVGSSEVEMSITTDTTINQLMTDLKGKFSGLDATADVSFTDGKLSISSDKLFQISDVSGNFTYLFRLNDSYLRKDTDNNYVLESSGDVGAYSSLKSLSDLGITGDQTLTINGTNVSLKETDSISTVISKINTSVKDINAIYDDKSGKIVLTSKTTGSNVIDVSSTNQNLLDKLGFSVQTFTLGNVAKATVLMNGYSQEITSSTNDITLNGLTMNLNSTGFTTVTVSADKDKIVQNVKDFVNKWNEVTDFLYTKMTESKVTNKTEDEMSEDEKIQGLLKNDSMIRRIFDKFRSFLTTKVDGKTLIDLGITSGDVGRSFDNTMRGKITLNEDKLKSFIENNGTDAVWAFFGKNDSTGKGLSVQIKEYSYNLTKFGGDIDKIAGTTGRMESEKRALSKRMVSMLEYLQKREEMLWAKYSSLESALSKLSVQGNFISQVTSSNK
ncbi:MAG TPA: flagellar filament capping protein FliD [Fervidobacterium sp.]|nr:flagellar filament capping protein FliD [Fervidobacterium sp.]HPC24001.1 flagellar filament capping protein FliD [Fervidobacterium sp.]HQQ16883.1 flagellar filament capping protein FliD [Fervidobacterium sp.]